MEDCGKILVLANDREFTKVTISSKGAYGIPRNETKRNETTGNRRNKARKLFL